MVPVVGNLRVRSAWMPPGPCRFAATAVVAMMVVLASSPCLFAQEQPVKLVFGGDTALVLNYVLADKAADFEAIVAKVKAALAKSERPVRRQQAANWRVFKTTGPAPPGKVVYLFAMMPPLRGADYAIPTILAEELPAEAKELSRKLVDAYGDPPHQVSFDLSSFMSFALPPRATPPKKAPPKKKKDLED